MVEKMLSRGGEKRYPIGMAKPRSVGSGLVPRINSRAESRSRLEADWAIRRLFEAPAFEDVRAIFELGFGEGLEFGHPVG
jgi:hypothetical protein